MKQTTKFTSVKMQKKCLGQATVGSCYLELQGILWNTSRYPYFDIWDFQSWENKI